MRYCPPFSPTVVPLSVGDVIWDELFINLGRETSFPVVRRMLLVKTHGGGQHEFRWPK